MADATRSIIYEFGPYRLDPSKRLLIRDGDKNLPLPPKTFDLLLMLVEARGRVFTKKDLMAALWSDTFVEESALSFQVSSLRKVLGENGSEWIENLPRYGYRFTADVTEIVNADRPENKTAAFGEPPKLDTTTQFETALEPVDRQDPRVRLGMRNWVYWLPASVLGLAAAALAWTLFFRAAEPTSVVRFQILPPDQVSVFDLDSLALSPDGETLAFIGLGPHSKRQIWIRPIASLTATQLAGTELVDAMFWSPDSRSLAFFAGGNLKRMDLQSGKVLTICESFGGRSSGTWNRDGTILFESTKRREIYRVRDSGGEPKPLLALDRANREIRHAGPQFLPDGRHFIYFVQSESPEQTGIYVASLDLTVRKQLLNSYTNALEAQLRGGGTYLLFTRGAALLAQSFDLKRLELRGVPETLVHRIFIEVSGGIARALMSASQNGVLAYRTQSSEESTELLWLDRQGHRLGIVGTPGDYSNPALSPDGSKLIVSRSDPQIRTRDLWLYDLTTGVSSRFTFDPDDEDFGVWARDGSRIAYNVVHDGIAQLYQKAIAGTSRPELLLPLDEFKTYKTIRAWSPDGRFLFFGSGPNTWALPMNPQRKAIGPFEMEFPRLSPNGKWIAFTSDESGQSEVYVQSFPEGSGKWQITTHGGMEPEWRADGQELYFVSGESLYAMKVRSDPKAFEPGLAKPLFDVKLETRRRRRYQVAMNGERFLVNVPQRPSPLTVEINWANGR